MSVLRRVIAVAFGATIAAQAAGAQATQQREGFWFNIGLGYGSLGCQDCFAREGGLSGGLALGGTLNQRVQLGVATNGWTRNEAGVTLSAGTLTALIRFYPSATGGFFLNGGIGMGSVDLSVAGYGSASEYGAGAVLGLGYDFRVGRMVSLTPFWNGIGISMSEGGDANFGQVGLGITWH